MRRFTGPLSGLFFLLLMAGCAGITEDPTKDWSPEKFYTEAKEKVAEGDYETGIKYFETLEARYPYGRYAEQAQLEIAYANYKYEEPALAIAAADRFIRLHPTHPNVDYAYYLKGLVNFHGEKGFDQLAVRRQGRSLRPRPQGRARGLQRLQRGRAALPQQPLRRGLAEPHGLSVRGPGEVRNPGGALLL